MFRIFGICIVGGVSYTLYKQYISIQYKNNILKNKKSLYNDALYTQKNMSFSNENEYYQKVFDKWINGWK